MGRPPEQSLDAEDMAPLPSHILPLPFLGGPLPRLFFLLGASCSKGGLLGFPAWAAKTTKASGTRCMLDLEGLGTSGRGVPAKTR